MCIRDRSQVLTGLHVLSTIDSIGESVYLNAHRILIENSIGAIADRLTDAEDGAMGSNIIDMARVIVEKCSGYTSDPEGIKENAIDAVARLKTKIMVAELKFKESEKRNN